MVAERTGFMNSNCFVLLPLEILWMTTNDLRL